MRYLSILFLFLLFGHGASSQCIVSIAAINDASCGANNGSVVLTFSGGVPPYYVNFNGLLVGSPLGAQLLIPNLAPGSYWFTSTDANGTMCTGLANLVINTWGNPVTVSFVTGNPTCQGCSDGFIQATATGGFPPYSYLWSNGATTPYIGNLSAGIYVLSVYDSSGCTSTDTVVLSYGGANLFSISGKAYYDVDNDSVFGANDYPLAQQQIEKQPSGDITYTDQNGNYIFGDTTNASFTISYLPTNGFNVSDGVISHNVTVGTSNISGLNFALQPDSLFHAVFATSFTALPRCNTNVAFQTIVTNQGTYIDSGSVTFNFDAQMLYTGSNPVGNVSGNSVTFNFSQLLPYETRIFYSNYNLPGAGSFLYTSTTAYLADGNGNILATDTTYHGYTVLCGFDPNDKQVIPPGDGANNRVDMEEELRYLIRFQNTGNDTAFNIVVTDTISSRLDINSLYVISTSHLCWIEKLGGELMRFHFDDILLPDSNVNEPASHGYVYFRVSGNPLNSDPTIVTNTANIYFDFNPPVTTNTTLTTFSNATVGIAPIRNPTPGTIALSPQPMKESTFVQFDGKEDHLHTLELLDISGRQINSYSFKGTTYLLQRSNLSGGTYLLKISDVLSKEVYYGKVIVE